MKHVGNLIPKAFMPDLRLALLLLILLALLRTFGPQESLRQKQPDPAVEQPRQSAAQAPNHTPAPGHTSAPRYVSRADTVNGERLADPVLAERIERIAATLPPHLLAGVGHSANSRYLAHGFGAGDDAPIFYGLFREPAAALAFGCAVDDHLADTCPVVKPSSTGSAYEDPSGVRCTPLGIALGSASYEPDRCEAIS